MQNICSTRDRNCTLLFKYINTAQVNEATRCMPFVSGNDISVVCAATLWLEEKWELPVSDTYSLTGIYLLMW